MITKSSKTSEKLIHLANWLDANVPPERFDFSTWGSDGAAHAMPPSCGTIACAAGWADSSFTGCEGYEVAWHKIKGSERWWFRCGTLEAWLDLDTESKWRKGECGGITDFDRLFGDADNRLAHDDNMRWVPLHRVTARIRACAAHYARMGR